MRRQATSRLVTGVRFDRHLGVLFPDDRHRRPQATPALRAAYERLHALGWAHSVEVWTLDGMLAGGLYGVSIGGFFAAESMFYRVTDASKIALVALVQQCRASGVDLVDVQMPSSHLESMGAVTVTRAEYLRRLAGVVDRTVNFTSARFVPPVE